jgi:hypothetical protein
MIEIMKKIIKENTNLAGWIEMDLAENESMDDEEKKNLKSLLNMLKKAAGKALFSMMTALRWLEKAGAPTEPMSIETVKLFANFGK